MDNIQREQARLRKQRQRDKEKGRDIISREKSVTLPDIMVDPIKRTALIRVCESFAVSYHPELAKTIWVGGHCLSDYMSVFNLA